MIGMKRDSVKREVLDETADTAVLRVRGSKDRRLKVVGSGRGIYRSRHTLSLRSIVAVLLDLLWLFSFSSTIVQGT